MQNIMQSSVGLYLLGLKCILVVIFKSFHFGKPIFCHHCGVFVPILVVSSVHFLSLFQYPAYEHTINTHQ